MPSPASGASPSPPWPDIALKSCVCVCVCGLARPPRTAGPLSKRPRSEGHSDSGSLLSAVVGAHGPLSKADEERWRVQRDGLQSGVLRCVCISLSYLARFAGHERRIRLLGKGALSQYICWPLASKASAAADAASDAPHRVETPSRDRTERDVSTEFKVFTTRSPSSLTTSAHMPLMSAAAAATATTATDNNERAHSPNNVRRGSSPFFWHRRRRP
jgi:hypothetical protein